MKCEHGITPWWDCDPCRGTANFGEEPLTPYYDGELEAEIRTRGERRAIMKAKGLEYHDVSKKKRGKVYVCLGS